MFELEKRRRFDKIFPIAWSVFVVVVLLGSTSYYLYLKNKINSVPVANNTATEQTLAVAEQPSEVKEEVPQTVKETITEAPPKHPTSSKIQGKQITTSAGSATAVSTGGELTSEDVSKLSSYSTMGAASSITYSDTTGRYPGLGDTLKNFVNSNLLHTTDLAFMYEIRIIDCAECNYSGLYTGSYMQSGSDITKAYGYITLNALPYKDNARFTDYMKLILAHEYGHHYTLYHRWVDLDIPSGQRFPDAYYNVRPLSKATTAYDYSLGWEDCDAEILAEDYSYIYSGYGYHGMSNVYGYPSSPGTKNWLISLGQSTPAPATPETPAIPTTPPETTPETPVAPTTPVADTVPPEVQFLKPNDLQTVTGDFEIQVNATDDIKLDRIELYFDDVLVLNIKRPFIGTMDSTQIENGEHIIKAKAYDSSGNVKEVSITITVDNPV